VGLEALTRDQQREGCSLDQDAAAGRAASEMLRDVCAVRRFEDGNIKARNAPWLLSSPIPLGENEKAALRFVG
jgi:hypothetical protein